MAVIVGDCVGWEECGTKKQKSGVETRNSVTAE